MLVGKVMQTDDISEQDATEEESFDMNKNFTSKEISWLSFNNRVLQEATDPTVPLIERITFLGIFSSNLDEFFRVRVATLKRLSRLGKRAESLIRNKPTEILQQIHEIVLEQTEKFNQIYEGILLELAEHNIFIVNEHQLDERQGEFVKSYFWKEVRPKLFLIMLNPKARFPELQDKSIYLFVNMAKKGSSKKKRFSLIEVPTEHSPRFLLLPSPNDNRYIILLDDVIRYNLHELFSTLHYDEYHAYTIKLTRDAELDIEDDVSQSYINKIHKSLRKRRGGHPVRFVFDEQIPEDDLDMLLKKFNVKKNDAIIPGARYHNFKDFMKFPRIGPDFLVYSETPKLPHKMLPQHDSLLSVIRKKDILLHIAYQSFTYIIDMLREASIDPRVSSIKITLYRLAKNSSIVNALVNAVKNGKQVTVVLELQARFDEEANIFWADKFQQEGVKVIFGVPGLKVHAKLCLITRREKGKDMYYGVVGTGNFNEDTAKIYSDHCLLTADRRIMKEVAKVFEFFENNYNVNSFSHLVVAPFYMRKYFTKLIKNEMKNAEAGKEAYIILKLNNLADYNIIQQLYEASQAGVKIRLMVRGMFSLVPGIEGVSENIEATGIVDKFLEHSRIFVFCNDGDEKYFLSSADWMPRNFDRRVETACPIYDKDLQDELKAFLDYQWKDNTKARILDKKLKNKYKDGAFTSSSRAQKDFYFYLRDHIGHR